MEMNEKFKDDLILFKLFLAKDAKIVMFVYFYFFFEIDCIACLLIFL